MKGGAGGSTCPELFTVALRRSLQMRALDAGTAEITGSTN
jgi:hypothetical protein